MGGRIHILVNCAGIQRRSPCVDFSEKDWDDVRLPRLPPGLVMSGSINPCSPLRSAFSPGHRRQSQVRLAAVSSCWQAYDSPPRREDRQFLFPDVISGRAYHPGLYCRQGCPGPANEISQQRMEPTQCPGQRYRSWVYCHQHVSVISSTARCTDHLENIQILVPEAMLKHCTFSAH